LTGDGLSGAIAKAAQILIEGGLVAFPTETVYGLGADARNGRAVARIFEAKGRPRFNPLIVHVANLDAARHYGQFGAVAERLAARFWPGPLTLVVPLAPHASLSDLVTAGLETVALRVPSHPVARAILSAAKLPIAAPSANVSGRISATAAEHVRDDFGDAVDFIVDGGPTETGLESTIVSLSREPILLRAGAIPREAIESALRQPLIAAAKGQIQSPGQLESHYAPRARMRLNASAARDGEVLLAFGGGWPDAALNLSDSEDLREAAANLFAYMRALDSRSPAGIAVTAIPETGLGEAINDRLRRAAAPRLGDDRR